MRQEDFLLVHHFFVRPSVSVAQWSRWSSGVSGDKSFAFAVILKAGLLSDLILNDDNFTALILNLIIEFFGNSAALVTTS